MHTCFDAYIVYGFNEGNRDSIIEWAWAEENDFVVGALDIVRGYCGEACYGKYAEIGKEGQLVISSEDKKLVDDLFERFMKFKNLPLKQAEDESSFEYPTLGFHLIIKGDYEICSTSYTLDDVEEDI